jgi:hypothetical protein
MAVLPGRKRPHTAANAVFSQLTPGSASLATSGTRRCERNGRGGVVLVLVAVGLRVGVGGIGATLMASSDDRTAYTKSVLIF